MFDGRFRGAVDRRTEPLGRALRRLGLSADVLTLLGLGWCAGTAVAIGAGLWPLAIVLLIIAGFHDLFDGAVAKATGTSSVRGAFLDSVADRFADALLFSGAAWYLAVHREGTLVLVPYAILAVSFLVSYERAKAESLGLPAKGGLMERAERMILLGVALLTTAIFVPVLIALLALTSLTAIGRFSRIWTVAGRPERPVARRRAYGLRTGPTATRLQDRTVAAVARWRTARIEARSRAEERRREREHRAAHRRRGK